MNLTEKKQYVYSQKGQLIARMSYEDYTEKYGVPKCCSSNGQNYIFMKDHNNETYMDFKDNILSELNQSDPDQDKINAMEE